MISSLEFEILGSYCIENSTKVYIFSIIKFITILYKFMKPYLKHSIVLFICILFSILTFAQEKKESGEGDEKPEKKTITSITKSCKKTDGLFPIFQDTIKGNIFMMVSKEQLDKEYIHFFHAENGGLNYGWVKGSYGWEKVFKIQKYFNRLEFVEQNTSFYFDENAALAKSAKANINEPIFSSLKIEVESGDSLLIAADALFKSEDFAQLTFSFPPGLGPKNPFKIGSLSKDKSKISSFKSFPENILVTVDYVFENMSPTNYGLPTTTDARFSTIQVQHNILEMPDNDYVPRYEDPRVGHFVTQVDDQLSHSETPYRDMIHRWHLVKKNPEAELSEPVEPITFWMENTTPIKYRGIIKSAIERWNIAFETAGFKNAVVVKQQPDDADWEAGDVRYNVMRWTAAPYMGSAWGPSFVNPRTGQILAADIMMDFVFLRGSTRELELFGHDGKSIADLIKEDIDLSKSVNNHQHKFCSVQHAAARKMLFGKTVTNVLDYDDEEIQRLTEEVLIEVAMHEVGHTLGLAHNYIASHLWDSKQVHDRSLTEIHGMTSSVMDYNPLNLAPNKEDQGNYQSVVPGEYDKWAIEYAYSTALDDPEAEEARLDKILSRSVEDQLRFGNDADAMFGSSSGIDPRINAWELTNDVLSYGEDRIGLCKKTMGMLMERLTQDGKSYEKLYAGFRILQSQQFQVLRAVTRYIGGVQIDRNFKGQKENGKPFTPIPYGKQKQALDMVINHGFSPTAFAASNDVFSHLQYQRRGWEFWGNTEDPKILERIGSYQRILLSHLLHPTVMKRMNNSLHYGNTYTVAQLLQDLTQGIFDQDIKAYVNPARQNLQLEYVNALLSALSADTYDHISKSAILNQLEEINKKMSKNKGKHIDVKAHRKHILFIIDKALDS